MHPIANIKSGRAAAEIAGERGVTAENGRGARLAAARAATSASLGELTTHQPRRASRRRSRAGLATALVLAAALAGASHASAQPSAPLGSTFPRASSRSVTD